MKFLYDFFPVLLFFITYKSSHDIYLATGILMVATIIQVAGYWIKNRSVEKMHIISLVLILTLGGTTLLLQDDIFIKWKPTIINWLFALVFLGSALVGNKPLIQRMMGHAITLEKEYAQAIWKRLNMGWVVFFLFSGALNMYFAFYYGQHLSLEERQETWVNFKFYGLFGLTFLFIFAQAFYLQRYMVEDNESAKP